MKDYLKYIYEKLSLEKDSFVDVINAYDAISKNKKANEVFLSTISLYKDDKNIDYNKILDNMKVLASLSNLNEYLVNLLVLLCLTKTAEKLYHQYKLSDSLFVDTFKDIGYKIIECKLVKGKWGVFVPFWYKIFFDLTIFSFGRLQYQIYTTDFDDEKLNIKKGDKCLTIHIPRNGERLDIKKVNDSIQIATNFFKSTHPEIFKNDKLIFTCFSWLLFDKTIEFSKENSNIYNFAKLFNIVRKEELDDLAEVWRLYDAEFTTINDLKEDTSLRKKYKEYFISGGKFGESLGYFVK